MPDVATWKTMILAEVGAGLDGSTETARVTLDLVSGSIDVIWDAWQGKAGFPRLQYLYAKRQCISIILGQNRLKIDKTLGPLSQRMGSYFDHLVQMMKLVTDEIAIAEKQFRANRQAVVGPSLVRAPIEPAAARPINLTEADPNDPRYRGSPF